MLQLEHPQDSELWQTFLFEKVPSIKDRYDIYSIQLRKQMIDFFDFKLNQTLSAYFASLKHQSKVNAQISEEPATVSP